MKKEEKTNPYASEKDKKPDNKLSENGLKVPENYEQFFVPAIGRPVARDLVRLADLRPGENVLDTACGTGIVARLASEKVGDKGSVTGLDVNPGMLAVARSVTPMNKSIEWHQASVEAMPLPDERFDVVFCQLGLQFVEDKPAALNEMRRVLKSGGRLYLNMPGPAGSLFVIFAEAMKKLIGPEAAGFVTHVFSLNDTSEIRQLIKNAGFQDISVEAENKMLTLPAPEEFLWQYVQSTPLFGVWSQVDEKVQKSLEQEIVEKWQDFEEDGSMQYRQRIVIAGGRK